MRFLSSFFSYKPVQPQGLELSVFKSSDITIAQDIRDIALGSVVYKDSYLNQLESVYGTEKVKSLKNLKLKGVLLEQYLPTTLNKESLLNLHSILGNSVTTDSLQVFWNNIQNNTEILDLSHIADDQREILNLEDLSADSFEKIYYTYQNLPKILLKENGSVTASISKFFDNRISAITRYSSEVADIFHANSQSKETAFAGPEKLARTLAYGRTENMQMGAIVPIYNHEKSEKIFYKLENKVNNEGLHAYFFAPMGRNDVPIQLVFRGTKGLNSIQRDLDYNGVGKHGFDQVKDRVLDIVKAYSTKHNISSVDICGHSLGAADAQRAVAALIEDKAANPNSYPVDSIRLFSFCSPKLDTSTTLQWKTNLEQMTTQQNPCQIELNFAHNENDGVTLTGDENLSKAGFGFVSENHLIEDTPSSMLWTKHHHTNHFLKDGILNRFHNRTFQYFNSSEYQQLHQKKAQLEQDDYEEVRNDQTTHSILSEAEKVELKTIYANIDRTEKVRNKAQSQKFGFTTKANLGFKTLSNLFNRTFKPATYLVLRVATRFF